MDKKLSNMKQSIKFMSIMAKVGYIGSIIAFCSCTAVIIALAITGGETSVTIGEGTKIVVADNNVDVNVTIASCAVWIVISAFLFAILFLTFRILNEITKSETLFDEKHVKTIKLIGVLIVLMTVCGGVAELIATYCVGVETLSVYSEIPGIMIGAIVFCVAFVYDYACDKIKQQAITEDKQ